MLKVEMGSVMYCSTVTHRLTVIPVMELSVDVLTWDALFQLPTHWTQADQGPRSYPQPPSLRR